MNELAYKAKPMTETGLVQAGYTAIKGLIVSSHTSGTFKLNNGITADADGEKATTTLTVVTTPIADGDTINLGGQVYTFKSELSADPTVANEVLIGASDATALDNLKLAVIGAGTEGEIGVKYSEGTVANAYVTATTNGDTSQVFEALAVGTSYNSVVTVSSNEGVTFTGATLAGGVDVAPILIDTYTLASGSQTISFPEPVEFKAGAYLTIGGTSVKLSVIYA